MSDSLQAEWMREAIDLAVTASGKGEVPVGAVVVREIGRAHV